MDTLYIIVAIILVILIATLLLDDNVEGFCPEQSPTAEQMAAMGDTAEQACNKISSRAEEIEAHYNGIEGVMANLPGTALFNPNNYKSGENKAEELMRNIINVNMSSCDVTEIQNACSNSSATMQTNIIDNSKCKWCETHECNIDGVTQTNASTINQRCIVQTAIETLLKKKSSIDAQALAKVLQKADGLLSGDNTVKTEKCNVLNTDLSSQRYLESLATCSNELSLDQNNHILFCGGITNVVQDNQYDAFQDCLSTLGVQTTFDLEADTKIKQETGIEQESSGVTPLSSGISIVISCIICIMLSGVVAYFGLPMLETDEKNKDVEQ